MVTQYFTFGCGQAFPNTYFEIVAENSKRCRELMFEKFGTKWSMQYDKCDDLIKYGMQKIARIKEQEGEPDLMVVFPAVFINGALQ
ncbi:hypothetical protein VP5_gp40 [Vibrio phage VP5]|uniref:hypothetical protein n=1 Tax=Vibrio phage VP5 TaxID=260827 RepID=UPI00003CEC5C|nr:hypothetical protein VP5_gp40 [Vibrio phage VP5]